MCVWTRTHTHTRGACSGDFIDYHTKHNEKHRPHSCTHKKQKIPFSRNHLGYSLSLFLFCPSETRPRIVLAFCGSTLVDSVCSSVVSGRRPTWTLRGSANVQVAAGWAKPGRPLHLWWGKAGSAQGCSSWNSHLKIQGSIKQKSKRLHVRDNCMREGVNYHLVSQWLLTNQWVSSYGLRPCFHTDSVSPRVCR